MPIAVRKKKVSIDDAEFVIAPLFYKQSEAYADKLREYNEKYKDRAATATLVKEQVDWLRDLTLTVIAWSLNNAAAATLKDNGHAADPPHTAESLYEQIDDVLASKLYREVMLFTGIPVPSEEEVAKRTRERQEAAAKAAETGTPPEPVSVGETPASS